MENKGNNNIIRIAQVLGNAQCGGVINCILNYYRHIDRTRVQFDFFTNGPSPYDEEIRQLGGNVYYYPKVFSFFAAMRVLRRSLRGYRAVHVHMTTLSFVALWAAKRAKVPVRICHAHSTTNTKEGYKHLVKNLLRYPTRCFATHYMGCCAKSNRWLFGRNAKAHLLHNAIEPERFSACDRTSVRRQFGLENAVVYGFIGRLEVQKNPLFLVRAFARVHAEQPNARLVIVGDGSMAAQVQRTIARCGVKDAVVLLPDIADVPKYYALFDVFVLPSLFEGLPLVAIEAQAAGIPCVLSTDITDEVCVGGNCTFVSTNDEGPWAEAMLQASRIGVGNAAPLASYGYDIAVEAPRLLQWYEENV